MLSVFDEWPGSACGMFQHRSKTFVCSSVALTILVVDIFAFHVWDKTGWTLRVIWLINFTRKRTTVRGYGTESLLVLWRSGERSAFLCLHCMFALCMQLRGARQKKTGACVSSPPLAINSSQDIWHPHKHPGHCSSSHFSAEIGQTRIAVSTLALHIVS